MANFELEYDELKGLTEKIEEYGVEAYKIINDVIHKEGADLIKNDITLLIPRSGRTWKGKGRSASQAMPGAFKQKNEEFAVTIAPRKKYHYLYFPDDGSDTKRHAGNQHFMLRGAENASSKVIDLCIGKLTEGFDNK